MVASVEGTAGVIQYAEARTYLQLLDRGEKTMNSPESEYHFELKDAYFVRVRVDAAKLAPILFRMSCQNWGVARGTPGSRDLLVGVGPDHMAREVEATLAWLQHQGEQGQRLAKLASLRGSYPLLSRCGCWDGSHRRIGLIATGSSDCMIE